MSGGQLYTSSAPSGIASQIVGPKSSTVRLLYIGSNQFVVMDGFGSLFAY